VYAGHFAVGLALKAREPKAPLWGILLGVGLLDLLFAVLVLAGVEEATITSGVPPGYSLDFIDWSHSLLTSAVWAGVFGALFWRAGGRIAALMGIAVFSHFLLDLPMHPPDMALWPGSDVQLGLGLWRALPSGWWFVELAFVLVLTGYYVSRARRSDTFGGRAEAVRWVMIGLHVANAPWLSPL
jgi:membrane-bound metal-dependent hydrolase YbcI (DUF457 family)